MELLFGYIKTQWIRKKITSIVVFIKQIHKMISQQFSTKVHSSVRNMSSALYNVQRPETEVQKGVVWAFTLQKQNRFIEGKGVPCASWSVSLIAKRSRTN